MTADRIVEFQRLHAAQGLVQVLLRQAEQRAAEREQRIEALLAELEVERDHNSVMVAMAQRDRRLLQALRAELMQVRGILGEELR